MLEYQSDFGPQYNNSRIFFNSYDAKKQFSENLWVSEVPAISNE